MGRPWWHDNYWENLDSERSRKLRILCPHCGSDKVYFNKRFRVWRCGKCEGSFTVKVVEGGWGKQLWDRIVSSIKRLYSAAGPRTGSGR